MGHFFNDNVFVHSDHDFDPDPDRDRDHGINPDIDLDPDPDPDHDRDRNSARDRDRDHAPDREPDLHLCFALLIYLTTPKDSIAAVWIYKYGQTGCASFHAASVNAPVS